MTGATLAAALAGSLAAALVVPTRPRPAAPARDHAVPGAGVGWLMRHRLLWSLLAAVGGAVFIGGASGSVAAVAIGVGTWVGIGRAEPPAVRRRREAVRHELPHVVALLGSALRAGAGVAEGVRLVCGALPGAAAEDLAHLASRLELGADPAQVWGVLARDPVLAPLGRTMGRAHSSGTPVVTAVERLADELGRSARAEVEDQARAVGVKAALPLGLCLLPAFVLIGIVPLVAGLMSSLVW